jgi:hypothetical protein
LKKGWSCRSILVSSLGASNEAVKKSDFYANYCGVASRTVEVS